MKVLKYVLAPKRFQAINMPRGALVLHVAAQGADLCVWVLANPKLPVEARQFAALATGEDVPASAGTYIGTGVFLDGHVFHVFGERG